MVHEFGPDLPSVELSADHALDQVGEFPCDGVGQRTRLCGGQAWDLQSQADVPAAEVVALCERADLRPLEGLLGDAVGQVLAPGEGIPPGEASAWSVCAAQGVGVGESPFESFGRVAGGGGGGCGGLGLVRARRCPRGEGGGESPQGSLIG
ncbi:hypothetical protein SGL43_03253 [Streptomyces globisporus]|uniref:Uncharacterized protein n=1 Tax=Streptomyces globisporus TaxID=1908 RepID=A0ABN8V157_STRGL|nr:hypothetical protein SGL43_03253 [Streptomyces globisporus]